MRQNIFFVLCLSLVTFLMSSCQKDLPPGDYDASEVGQIKKVSPGVVLSIRPVRLHNPGAEPGVLGGSAESSGYNAAQLRSHGAEYVVKLNSGSIISVVQAENIQLKAKQRVLVIYGHNTRIVPDHGSEDL